MHKQHLGKYPNEVTADSGYCSEKNLLFLEVNHIESYIKLQEHEVMKTRAYKTVVDDPFYPPFDGVRSLWTDELVVQQRLEFKES